MDLKIDHTLDNNQVNTVIIGAGPVGLLNAIGLLNKNPERNVVMLEKYDQYKRNHTLRVDYVQIKKYVEACGEPVDPVLQQLMQDVKQNHFIRISEIERRLKLRAQELGAHIITNAGVSDFNEQVLKHYPNADLILGADGTRSVVSQQAIGKSYAFAVLAEDTVFEENKIYFSEDNGQLAYSVLNPEKELVFEKVLAGEQFQVTPPLDMKKLNEMKNEILDATSANGDTVVISNSLKKEFDFVLQFRFEVEGDVQPVPFLTLMRFMQNYGITCDEYVGKMNENGSTPINLQLMITKEQYQLLEAQAKSGNPIKPFSFDSQDGAKAEIVPELLMQQIKGYLGLRLRHFTQPDEVVRLDTATISVNEAPATYAKEVFKRITREDGREVDVVLVGDAAMGLSYFKGINAGIESSARLLTHLNQPLDEREAGLTDYKSWFEDSYAPSKVNEVRNYSSYVIGATMSLFKTLQFILRGDTLMKADVAERTVDLYRGHLAQVMHSRTDESIDASLWEKNYVHDMRKINNVLTMQPESPLATLASIGKNMVDGIKLYKSTFHLLRDVLLPVRAVYQAVIGVAQIGTALPISVIEVLVGLIKPAKFETRSGNLAYGITSFFARIAEGGARIALALNLAITSLFLPFRLAVRGVSTLVSGPALIEENPGFKRILDKANATDESSTVGMLSSLSVDLHRKFEKSSGRGQATHVDVEQERNLFKKCAVANDVEAYNAYFRLFTSETSAETEHNDLNVTPVSGSVTTA